MKKAIIIILALVIIAGCGGSPGVKQKGNKNADITVEINGEEVKEGYWYDRFEKMDVNGTKYFLVGKVDNGYSITEFKGSITEENGLFKIQPKDDPLKIIILPKGKLLDGNKMVVKVKGKREEPVIMHVKSKNMFVHGESVCWKPSVYWKPDVKESYYKFNTYDTFKVYKEVGDFYEVNFLIAWGFIRSEAVEKIKGNVAKVKENSFIFLSPGISKGDSFSSVGYLKKGVEIIISNELESCLKIFVAPPNRKGYIKKKSVVKIITKGSWFE